MRFTSTSAAFVASLLAKDVLAAVHRGHKEFHAKRAELTVTDDVVETIVVTNYITVEWPPATASPEVAIAAVKPTTSSPAPAKTTPAVVPAPAPATTFAKVVKPTTSAAPVAAAPVAPVVPAAPKIEAAVAVKPSTSAAAPVASSPPSSSGGKRGLAYNDPSLTSAFAGSSKVTWAYNWGSSSDGLTGSFEYVPLLWGLASEFVDAWDSAVSKALASGSTHLMSFNEPDLSSQSNIGVAAAAAAYKTHMMPYAGKAKLGAPAVTNGGSPMGLDYLSSFISACSGCQIDFISIHWYDVASNVEYFKSHVQQAYTAGGNKPVWITEFGASGSDAEQAAFLDTVIPWLDAQDYVERYAYFMCSDGVLLTGNQLSTIGNAFVSA